MRSVHYDIITGGDPFPDNTVQQVTLTPTISMSETTPPTPDMQSEIELILI